MYSTKLARKLASRQNGPTRNYVTTSLTTCGDAVIYQRVAIKTAKEHY